MHAHGDLDASQRSRVLLDRAVIDGNARIIHRLVQRSVGVRLRRPAEIVERAGDVGIVEIDLENGDRLAAFGMIEKIVVLVAPPGGRIGGEGLAGISGVAARARCDVEELDLENVTRFSAADMDRAGADMDAEALSRAAAENRGVHRAGATAFDAFVVWCPGEDALGAGIAGDHAVPVVSGVLGERLDGDGRAGLDE